MSETSIIIKLKSIFPWRKTTDVNTVVEQDFQKIAIRRLVSKIDRRLIPFFIVLEMSCHINRTSIGHAKIMNIETDLHMSPSEKEWNISIFFLSYLFFGIPGNLLLRLIGPSRYLSWNTIVWGSLTVGMAFVKTAQQLLIVRFFLGIAVSAFFPSIVIYCSLWYRKQNQTMRIAIVYGSAIIGSTLGSILAQLIGHLDGIAGLKNWQWLFLLQGLPNIPLGIFALIFLGNVPETVQWLDNCEKQLLTNVLREDAGIGNSEFNSCVQLSWRQVAYNFMDWRIYLYALIGICDFGVIKILTMYLPSLVQSMGYSNEIAHFITASLYASAFVACLITNYSSSRCREYGFHLMICLFTALIGFILILNLSNGNNIGVLIGTFIASWGIFSAYPLVLSWVTNNIGGNTKKTIAIGFLICVSQIIGVLSPKIYRDEDKPTYRRGHLVSTGLLIVGLIVTFTLRLVLMLENRRRDRLSVEQHEREAAIKEPCDWHPDVRYTL